MDEKEQKEKRSLQLEMPHNLARLKRLRARKEKLGKKLEDLRKNKPTNERLNLDKYPKITPKEAKKRHKKSLQVGKQLVKNLNYHIKHRTPTN